LDVHTEIETLLPLSGANEGYLEDAKSAVGHVSTLNPSMGALSAAPKRNAVAKCGIQEFV